MTLEQRIRIDIAQMQRDLQELEGMLVHPGTVQTVMSNIATTAIRVAYMAGRVRGYEE